MRYWQDRCDAEVVQPHAERVRRLPRGRHQPHQRVVVREAAALHPLSQAAEVVEMPPDDDAHLLRLLRREIIRGHGRHGAGGPRG